VQRGAAALASTSAVAGAGARPPRGCRRSRRRPRAAATARPPPLAAAAALALLLLRAAGAPLPPCADLLEGGAWALSPGAPPAQGAFAPLPPCARRAWDVRGRAVAVVGDSVSRYMLFDAAWRALDCPPLAPAPRGEAFPALPTGAGMAPECVEAWEFMFRRAHGDLLLRAERANATLAFFWLQSYDALPARAPAVWGGAARFDAVLLAAGLWDVGISGGGGARACAAAAAAAPALRALAPRDRRALVVWTTPYAEPVWNDDAGMLETARFPAGELDAANACARAAAPAGARFFNATALVRAPAAALARVAPPRARARLPLPAPGALLTLDGYHPNNVTRAAIWAVFEDHFARLWEEDAGGGGGGEARPRRGPRAPPPWYSGALPTAAFAAATVAAAAWRVARINVAADEARAGGDAGKGGRTRGARGGGAL